MLNNTIKVMPAKIGLSSSGQKVSQFSSNAVEIVETGKYTWCVIDSHGGLTIGLGRTPVDTLDEAFEIAQKFAAIRGYKLVLT